MKKIYSLFVLFLLMLPNVSRGNLWYSISSSNNGYVAIYHSATPQGYYASNVFINIPSNHLRVASDTNYPWAERSAAQKYIVNYAESNRWFNTTNNLWYLNTGFDTNPAVIPGTLTESTILSGGILSGPITNLTINPGVISSVNLATETSSGRLDSPLLLFSFGEDVPVDFWDDSDPAQTLSDWKTSGQDVWSFHLQTGAPNAIVYVELNAASFDGGISFQTRRSSEKSPTNDVLMFSVQEGVFTNWIAAECIIPVSVTGGSAGSFDHRIVLFNEKSSTGETNVGLKLELRGWQ